MITNPATGTFIITLSLAHRLRMLAASSQLLVPASKSDEVLSFNARFCRMMRRLTTPHSLHVLDTFRLMDTLKARADELVAVDRKKVTLSICADMAAYTKDKSLGINRLYNPFGEYIGHGPRPGCEPIDTQLDRLSKYLMGKSIILIEDGVFTGGTLEFVLAKLAYRGNIISDILIGFCRLDAKGALEKSFSGRVKVVYKLDQVIDWLPSHDLLPFIPYSGRVLGCDDGSGDCVPMTYESLTHSYPYIEPFGMMGKWAGVSPTAAGEISRFGMQESIKLFRCMERLNGREIMIKDLVKSRSVSLPLQINKLVDPPRMRIRILDYLAMIWDILENKKY